MPYKDPEKAKEHRNEYNRKYRKTQQYRESQRKYYESDKGQERNIKYRNSPKGQATRKKWRKSPKGSEVHREMNLKRKYGIGLEEYNRLLEKQHGKCAICFEPPVYNHNLCVDHDHKTGKIRGLLCDKCNVTLGNCNDSPLVLQEAIRYLEKNI